MSYIPDSELAALWIQAYAANLEFVRVRGGLNATDAVELACRMSDVTIDHLGAQLYPYDKKESQP